jgi:hypothetical protein
MAIWASLGRDDPIWSTRPGEADRVERHSATVALLLASMGARLNDRAARSHALAIYHDWANCRNKPCWTAGCGRWAADQTARQSSATATHGTFRLEDAQAAARCETYLELVPAVGSYGLWAVLLARQAKAGDAADRHASLANQKRSP